MRYILLLVLILSLNISHGQQSDFSSINFAKADSIASTYRGASLDNLPILAYNLTSPLQSHVEKFRAIYTWVSVNISNDVKDYRINKKKRQKLRNDPIKLAEWNKKFASGVFRKLLEQKKTVCTGYAYLISELALLANLNTKIIDGYGRTSDANVRGIPIPNHSWNAVRLNDKWYLCDATWSSGGILLSTNEFISNYNDGYFLADPDLFVLNHYPLDTTWLLTTTEVGLDDFMRAPLVYKHAFSNEIKPIMPKSMSLEVKKGDHINFSFEITDDKIAKQMSIELLRGSSVTTIVPDRIKDGDLNHFEFKPTAKGHYDLHFKVGSDYVATYVLHVK